MIFHSFVWLFNACWSSTLHTYIYVLTLDSSTKDTIVNFNTEDMIETIVLVFMTKRLYCDNNAVEVLDQVSISFSNCCQFLSDKLKQFQENWKEVREMVEVFVSVCKTEVDSFWCLANYLDTKLPTIQQQVGEHLLGSDSFKYAGIHVGIGRQIKIVLYLLNTREPKLFQLLAAKEVSLAQLSWIKSSFAGFLPLDLVIK